MATFASGAEARPAAPAETGAVTLANILVVWPGGHWRDGLLDVAVTVALALRLTAETTVGTAVFWLLAASLTPCFVVLAAGVHGGSP